MVVTYRRPQDPLAFDRDYFGVHVPMAKKLPGLKRYMFSRAHRDIAHADDAYLVATLDFENQAAIESAFASEVIQAYRESGSRVEIEAARADDPAR